MDRRRRKVPRKNQLCLRLTDHQLYLLQRYGKHKDMDSEVDALRSIIDGLAPWLSRRDAEVQEGQAHSGLPSAPTSIAPSIAPSITPSVPSDVRNDGGNDARAQPSPKPTPLDESPSLGDFGGQPRLELPGMPFYGDRS